MARRSNKALTATTLSMMAFTIVLLATIVFEPDKGGIWSPEETPRIFGDQR